MYSKKLKYLFICNISHTTISKVRLVSTTMNSRAPFCKVCYDAGKPEELYASHFVKDRPGPDGRVVCPTLLNQECRYCKEKGHTPTHCPRLADKRLATVHYRQTPSTTSYRSDGWAYKTPRKTQPTLERVAPGAPKQDKKKTETPTVTNRFATLATDDTDADTDNEDTAFADVRKTLFAEGPRAVEESQKPALVGWAAVAAKPAVVVQTANLVKQVDASQETPKRQVKYPDNPWKQMGYEAEKRLMAKKSRKLRWGDDDEDSDDDLSSW